MNGLLLAEEFRSFLMKEALKLNPDIPEDYKWEFLDYSPNSDNENLPIRNLNHLKQVILEENITSDLEEVISSQIQEEIQQVLI